MAGDWIKIRSSLFSAPKLIALARHLQNERAFRDWLTPGGAGPANGQIVSDEALRYVALSCATRVWSAAREHGAFDGDDLILRGIDLFDLDAIAGAPCVGECMSKVGWAIAHEGGVILPNFKQHNVPLTPAERMKNSRDRVAHNAQQKRNSRLRRNVENVAPRVEERREEKSIVCSKEQTSAFAAFWEAYPRRHGRKVGKESARKLFGKLNDEDRALCLKAVEHYAAGCGDLPKDAQRFLQADFWRDWIGEPEEHHQRSRVPSLESLNNWNPTDGGGAIK